MEESEKTKKLRKFLKSGKAFKGWADTAEEMLEEVRLRIKRLSHVER